MRHEDILGKFQKYANFTILRPQYFSQKSFSERDQLQNGFLLFNMLTEYDRLVIRDSQVLAKLGVVL